MLELLLLIGVAVVVGAGMAAWYATRANAEPDPAGMLGLIGEALETFSGGGRVFVRGEEWQACSAHGIIEHGTLVRVVGYRHNMMLVVEPLSEELTDARRACSS